MEYTTLGGTGLQVSRICLGAMSFHHEAESWKIGPEAAKDVVDRAIDLGINFFDTANVYGYGDSEEILGEALADYNRDWTVVATKVFGNMDQSNPNASGLSRKAIEQELDNSLERLGMDTIDLYQIHKWDYEVPIEETLRTLNDAVRRGKVRYIGASSLMAFQLAESRHTSERLGLQPMISMQNHYNLAYREEEREMLPYCQENDIGVIPWSPLARGFLARPHREHSTTVRGKNDAENRGDRVSNYRNGGGEEINERVEEIAAQKDVSMAQIGIAWLLHKDWVTAPIVGVTKIEHLEEAAEAVEIDLSQSDIDYLEEPYSPVEVVGLTRSRP